MTLGKSQRYDLVDSVPHAMPDFTVLQGPANGTQGHWAIYKLRFGQDLGGAKQSRHSGHNALTPGHGYSAADATRLLKSTASSSQ